MSSINKNDILTKKDLILLFFNFHNVVNVNKKIEMYNIEDLKKYKYIKTEKVLKKFMINLKTYFQNELLVTEFTNWITLNRHKFNKGKKMDN